MAHRQGGKFTGSHTTVTDATGQVVDYVARLPSVTKISLGIIESKKNRMRRLKLREILAGWQVTVCGNTSIQIIYVFTDDREVVKNSLENFTW